MHDLLKMLDNPRSLLNFSLAILAVLALFFMLKSGAQADSRPVIDTQKRGAIILVGPEGDRAV
ncbi:TPA: hypothetical protein ACRMUB_000066 [Pseudomonas aeruginosa]|uniref:hypothetical protein n=1 Tax=Pseudomonas aeruginosa TaxID=287 RepID=UPI000E323423|nr:hypothetical protein [Pseudomonas aeruginosa]EKX3951677.1 hypothetical protein [Pseudomonas aeruginosa]MBA4941663.1 hypothetical protein [Pseudomonas aeruginosa]MCU8927234.1 hypothetical protein [Pseudomonas aeruginosa]MCU9033173.1 hypothetical protein [Pseudomonas aeruginosa]NPY51474.1 hypothetical protein [Pseudomonas aeruginosa]